MRGKAILGLVIILSVANIVSADVFDAGGANEFTIDFVNISGDTNPNNVFGIVNYDYRMGTYEITNGQWNAFVSAAGAPTGSEGGNIPGDAYDQSAFWTGTDVPTNNVSWYEGAQFINWLNTSTGHAAAYKFTGTQGTGDYTFAVWEQGDIGFDTSNPYRNSNAYYFLPTEDEWVKAAYWNGTNLQTYATKDNTAPDKWSPAGGPNSDGQAAGWNYDYAYPNNNNSNDQPWDVTAGYSPEELNGTFDMMGNVWEWMENPYFSGDYLPGSIRVIRGASYTDDDDPFSSSYRS